MARILTVDDSFSMRELVKITLQGCGHEVLVAAGGPEGLSILSKEKVDLIITDMNMPKMNGIEFIKALRSSGTRFTPVLVLTTEAGPALKEQARNAGATGWMVKPFQAASFLATVQKVLP